MMAGICSGYDIILASASPRRSALLLQAGFKFDVVVPDMKEEIDPEGWNGRPEVLTAFFAAEKARSVLPLIAGTYSGSVSRKAVIIAADTVVVKDGEIMGKLVSDEDAFRMLKSLQGSWHEVITAISAIDLLPMRQETAYETTRVRMRQLTDEEILFYINTGEPLDKAGGYGIQGTGALLVDRIEGCYFNVVGLPLAKLCRLLEGMGIC